MVFFALPFSINAQGLSGKHVLEMLANQLVSGKESSYSMQRYLRLSSVLKLNGNQNYACSVTEMDHFTFNRKLIKSSSNCHHARPPNWPNALTRSSLSKHYFFSISCLCKLTHLFLSILTSFAILPQSFLQYHFWKNFFLCLWHNVALFFVSQSFISAPPNPLQAFLSSWTSLWIVFDSFILIVSAIYFLLKVHLP